MGYQLRLLSLACMACFLTWSFSLGCSPVAAQPQAPILSTLAEQRMWVEGTSPAATIPFEMTRIIRKGNVFTVTREGQRDMHCSKLQILRYLKILAAQRRTLKGRYLTQKEFPAHILHPFLLHAQAGTTVIYEPSARTSAEVFEIHGADRFEWTYKYGDLIQSEVLSRTELDKHFLGEKLTECEENLKVLAISCDMYASDNAGRYPNALAKIGPSIIRTIPSCPLGEGLGYQYSFVSEPDAFTLICAGKRHSLSGIRPDFPRYSSRDGLTTVRSWPSAKPRNPKDASPANLLPESTQPGSSDPHIEVQSGHSAVVAQVAWSPNGESLVTAGSGEALLWDAGTGKVLRRMAAGMVAWSPDGRLLATSDNDKGHIWDALSGRQLATLSGHTNTIKLIAWSPDCRTLATGGADGTTRLWETSTGKEMFVLADLEPSGSLKSLAWSPDGRTLATCTFCGGLGLWNASTGKRLQVDTDEWRGVTSVAWSPDGHTLAALHGQSSDPPRLWDAATGKELHKLTGHSEHVDSLAWSPDGRTLATASRDNTARLWDVANGKVLQVLAGHKKSVMVVAWSPDGHSLATASVDEAVRTWDAATGKQLNLLAGHTAAIGSVAWSPDGRTLATASNDATARLWDASNGGQLKLLAGDSKWVTSVSWSPDGHTLANGSRDNSIRLWHWPNGKQLSLDGNSVRESATAWSPDGRTFASIVDNTARLWDATTGEIVQVLTGHAAALTSVAWSPDGLMLATCSLDSTARLWDAKTGRELHVLVGHTRELISVAWSSDGRTLATCSEDKTVKLWNTSSGEELHTLVDDFKDPGILSVAWSPDGRTLATCHSHQPVRLWNAANGKQLRELSAFSRTAFWSPDGRILATCSDDDTRLWVAATGQELRSLPTGSDAASWSPDGRSLATYRGWQVRLWNASGMPLGTLDCRANVTSVAWSPDGHTLATGSFSGNTRLWDTGTWTELVALYGFPEGDTAVVSPEGFFEGRLRGLHRLHWVIGLNPFDLEQFFSEFYQPGLFKDVLERHKPIRDILKERKDPRASLSILDKDRRAVLLDFSPRTDVALDRRTLDLTLNVRESGPDATHKQACGIKDLRVFHNGLLVWRSKESQAVSPGSVPVTVPIVAGKNIITAYAFNGDSVKCRDVSFEITGARSLERQGQAWVLAIGIDRYADPRYNLNFAGADALELGRTLQATLPFPEPDKNIHATILLDEKATRQGILEALTEIAKKAQPEDTVIVTYAGHGTNHGGHFYLLPHDIGAGDEDPLGHGVSDQDLQEVFLGMGAGHITLVLDACHSGQALESEEWRVGPMNSRGLPQLAWEKGMDILTASQSNETANEVSKVGHGILTYALLQGFKNAPRSEGSLAARHWLDFGVAQVPQILEQDKEVKLQMARGVKRHISGAKRPLLIQTPRVFHAREDSPDWMVSGPPGASKDR